MDENQISSEAASRSLNRLMRDGRILRVKQDSYTLSKSAKDGFRDRMTG
jgi:DNA-binding HxlR family transcriptional regulator